MRTRVLSAILAILTVAMAPSQLWAQAPTSEGRPQATPPQSGTVATDQTSISAGESITFHIVLDKPTNAPDSYVNVVVRGPRVGAQNSASLELGKTSIDVPVVIPADAPGGEWHLEIVMVGTRTGMHYSNLNHEGVTFTVIQKGTFDLPTEAKVSISLSQTQLLRREAGILQSWVEALKGVVLALPAGEHDPRAAGMLRENVLDADKALEKTEAEFLQVESTQSQKPAATIFFGDLHLTYQRALPPA
jgi:hypothetical protein